jgi:lysozyme family protein
MINIDALIDDLIHREGGYVNNPNDKGGETNYGITLVRARAYGYTGPMNVLPRATAAMIYKDLYWVAPHFDVVAQTMPTLAMELFDIGVNMGQEIAGRFVQRALNVLNNGGKDYPDIKIDGVLGKVSQYALTQFKAKRGASAETVLVRMVVAQKAVRYMGIAEANPSQETFEYGWVFNRVGDIK